MASSDLNKVPLRNWVFTVFNPTEVIEKKVLELQPLAIRLAVGREKCPTTGTPHLQGYIRFEKSRRFSWVKEHLPDGTHIELRKGSESQASKYALKDGDVLVDHGVDCDRGKDLKRTRNEETDEIIEEIDKGESYGRIRNRHRRFCFWHSDKVIREMVHHRRLQTDPEWDPAGEVVRDHDRYKKWCP